MSGVPRFLPTSLATPTWKSGRLNTPDTPPPPAPKPSFHTTSGDSRLPLLSSFSWVPPTEVTSGSDDGHEFTRNGYRVLASDSKSVAPASPEEASTVTPWASASLNANRRLSRLEKSPVSKPG